MPKGVPIKDHLDEPDFKILFATVKHSNLKETDFAQVAVEMGCKDATFARNLLNRTMKAQGKGAMPKKAAAGSKPTPKTPTKKDNGGDDNVINGANGGSAKKRKISATASEATTEKLDEDDADVKDEDEVKQESGTEDGEDD